VECLFAEPLGNFHTALGGGFRQYNSGLAGAADDVNNRGNESEHSEKYREYQKRREHFADVVNLQNNVAGEYCVEPLAPSFATGFRRNGRLGNGSLVSLDSLIALVFQIVYG